MATPKGWTILVYKIPAQPTRLRLAIWRRLQKMGALYLQDAVCILPDRADLTENLSYVASSIEEVDGTAYLFSATSLLPYSTEEIMAGFRKLADTRLNNIKERLERIQIALDTAETPTALEQVEEDLKRERLAYLHARKLAYCGNTPERETEVNNCFEQIKQALNHTYRDGIRK